MVSLPDERGLPPHRPFGPFLKTMPMEDRVKGALRQAPPELPIFSITLTYRKSFRADLALIARRRMP
jgi:hypothetical protein